MQTVPSSVVLTSRAARLVRRTITFVVFVIAGLAFVFGFGNGWTLGLQLGVPRWIAPLVAPAVDLSVVSLLVSVQHIRARGIAARMVGARLLLAFCGVVTFAINTAESVVEAQYGRAAYDAVAPLLLIMWGEVAPGLLALLHQPVAGDEDEPNSVPDGLPTPTGRTDPTAELVARARELDLVRRQEVGRPISRDRLRASLGISNALAGELVRIVRSTAQDGTDE